MKKRVLSLMIIISLIFCIFSTWNISAASSDSQEYILSDEYTEATFLSGYGDTNLILKNGFDFIDNGSSSVNWDLALAGATLSGQVYNGTGAEELLENLGYDEVQTTKPMNSDSNVAFHPVSSMGYKRLTDDQGNKKNVFAVIVRGTSNLSHDWITDLYDGAETMFDVSRGQVADDLKQFVRDKTGKSIDELKKEDNYFFLTGHSLGGAVANALSVDETVTSLCNSNKEHIYTYTFESPHTCVNLWWMDVEGMSNAYNFKDNDDGVTNVAPYIGATTYGKDKTFSVNDLDNSIFEKVFPNAKGGSVTEAPRPVNYGDVFGHHDRGLDLIYIIQHGITDGWWQQLYQFDGIISMWTEEDVKKVVPTQVDEKTKWFSIYYSYLTDNDKPLIWSDYSYSISGDTPIALHDFDVDGVPELILGYQGARLGLSVYTINDGEVVNAGCIGGKSSFYSDDASYHGIFRGDTIMSGAEGGVYYSGLSDGKLFTTEVYSFEYNMDTKEFEYTISDETLYDVYLECTDLNSNENASFREPRNSLKMDSWSNIQANGWESFINSYGYQSE